MLKSKFLKRAVCLLMSVVMLLLNFPITVQAEEEKVVTSGTLGDISWNYVNDTMIYGYGQTLVITGEGDIPSLEELGLEEYPWASFYFPSIVLSEGITNIPSYFSGNDIVNLSIPTTVKSIQSGAFYGEIHGIGISTYNMDCIYENNAFNISKEDLGMNVISGLEGSTTEIFANENELLFFSMNSTEKELDFDYNICDDHVEIRMC